MLLMYALPQGVILALLIGVPLGAFLGVEVGRSTSIGGRDPRPRSSFYGSIHHDVHITASGSEPGRSRIRITSGTAL